MVHPKPRPKRIENPRTARSAARARKVRSERARYTGIVRVSAVLATVLLMLMGYVMLTSNLTGLTYAVATAQHDREALQEEDTRLDDRIAALRSDDRLSAVAARLGMREAQTVAVVRLPMPAVADPGPHFPMLSSLAGLFMPAVARQR